MVFPQQAAILICAALTIPIVLCIVVPVIVWSRERRFRIREPDKRHTDRKVIAAEWDIPEVAASDTSISTRLNQLAPLLNVLHEEANGLQTRYHRQVARCVCCLGLALVMLGLSLTVYHNHNAFEGYASAVELLAFGVAFWSWWAARAANHRWVAARTKVELLRQWTFLSAFYERNGNLEPNGGEREFEIKAVEIDARIAAEPPKSWRQWLRAVTQVKSKSSETIESRLWKYWLDTRAYYLEKSASSTLTLSDFYFYMGRRPIRQLAWFRVAQLRVQWVANRRDWIMAALFAVSMALAFCKLALIASGVIHNVDVGSVTAGHRAIDFISFGLLLATALSAALTTLYLSRNDRSLMHRYAAQERCIEGWLHRVLDNSRGTDGSKVGQASSASVEFERLKIDRELDPIGSSSRTSGTVQAPLNHRLNEEVLEFEGLMIDELIDWIHISSHDALELAAP